MRAALFLVAGLLLAACSSAVPSSNANPPTPAAAGRLVPAGPAVEHLTLVFKDAESYAYLRMNAMPFSCIISVTPASINLNPSKTRTVNIDASVSDACAHTTAEVDFDISFSDVHLGVWKGALNIWHDPEKSEWTAKTRGDRVGPLDLCTDPPGFREGVHLQQNEQIDFSLC